MSLFEITLNKNIYKVYVVNNSDKINNKKLFLEELKFIELENNKEINLDSNIKICLDYEFNNGYIGLVQVMLSNKHKSNNVYLFHPNDFNKEELELIRNTIYLSKFPKILHGCEGLDIPYIYNHVLENRSDMIYKFTKTMTDTRFKCELVGHQKCSLYDILYGTHSINDKQYTAFKRLYEDNGLIYKIYWNTKKMTMSQYMYAAFDVIFLRRLNRMLNKEVRLINYNPKLLDEYTQYVLLFRNNHIRYSVDLKLFYMSEEEIKRFTELNKHTIIGIKIQYFKKPVIGLIRYYLENKDKINMLLDIMKFDLLKIDLSRLMLL